MIRGERIYEIARDELGREGIDWPHWLDLPPIERRAWELVDDTVLDRYAPEEHP